MVVLLGDWMDEEIKGGGWGGGVFWGGGGGGGGGGGAPAPHIRHCSLVWPDPTQEEGSGLLPNTNLFLTPHAN